jgi:hypothetical protein
MVPGLAHASGRRAGSSRNGGRAVSRRDPAVSERRLATAALPATGPRSATFVSETPYLSLGNVTPGECRAAAVTVCAIALRLGYGVAEGDEVLTILGLKEFARA